MDLRELLAPLSESEFFERHFQKGPVHVHGQPGKFDRLFSWEGLNRYLDDQRIDPAFLFLRKLGGTIDPSEYVVEFANEYGTRLVRLDQKKLATQLRDGATLSLHQFHQRIAPLQELMANLERRFAGACDMICFVSFGSTRGLSMHEDGDDQFVVQVAGRKRWRLFGETERFPLCSVRKRIARPEKAPEGGPTWEGTLEAGDVLYFPRGWWHEVVSIDEPSLHLTIGLPVHTGIDLIRDLCTRLADEEILRRDLPRHAGPAEKREHLRKLAAAIDRALGPEAIDEYFASILARKGPSFVGPAFPWSALEGPRVPADDWRVRCVGTGYARPERDEDGARLLWKALGRSWSAELEAEPLIRVLLDGEVLPIARARELGGKGTDALLAHLVREGLLCYQAPVARAVE